MRHFPSLKFAPSGCKYWDWIGRFWGELKKGKIFGDADVSDEKCSVKHVEMA